MKYNINGKFKIMQLADIQEIPNVSVDTVKLIDRALEEENPDLVVLTGDQIKGYGMSYGKKSGNKKQEVFDVLSKILEPVTKRGIPYAVTFGNHDNVAATSETSIFAF